MPFDPNFFPAKMKNKWLDKGSQLIQITVGTDIILEGLVAAIECIPQFQTCEHGPECKDHPAQYGMVMRMKLDADYDPTE